MCDNGMNVLMLCNAHAQMQAKHLGCYNSNICGDVHKKLRFKCQPSTPLQAFASMRSTPFIEIDDKGGEIV
jgi:hypothetical protein